VNITEAETEAMIEAEDGTYCTLSKSGRILETGIAELDKSIPLVTGYELSSQTPGKKAKSSDEQKTEILSELFEQLDALDFGNIVKIDISDRTDITMNYDNRIELSLGSSVNMDIKLSDLKKVIESLPNGYAGTLIYRSKDAGISAIPKEAEVPSAYVDNSSEEDDSSLEDRDDSQYGYGSDTTDDGNYDDGNYGGYGDNGDYTDNGYGYGDGDGYSGYGDDSDDGDDYGYGGYNYDDGYGDNGGDGYDYNYNYDYGTDGYSEDTYGTDNGYGY
jgi:cell division protein FtsQ